jgi:uracil-DNA glycosylase
MFLLSKDFLDILNTLYTDSKNDKRFTPTLKDIFRAFKECPYGELKVVVIGQDPYPSINVADGIAFSCSKDEKIQLPLKYIYKEIEDTVYPDGVRWDPDLKSWSNQGVLMLNTSLTTEINKIGSHAELWNPFTTYLLDMLADYNSGLIYVFMGDKAKEWHKMVPTNNYKFFTSHPVSGHYTKDKKWDSGNLFNQINKVMHKTYGEKIKW